jgi:2-methylcitrate dehydratase PrpD
MTVHERLGEFTASLRDAALPPEVVEKVRCNLLHDLACTMAATTIGPMVWPLVDGLAPGEATLLCSGARVPAEHAAFANAVLMHGRAQDDTHFSSKCHAGSAVIPAALAVAQREGASGARLVAAIVAGYEVMTALGDAFGPPSTARGFRASAIFGPLGAAAAASVLLDLDAAAAANAIALATSFSGGLNQTWIDGSTEWRWQPGMSARNGVLAARLAASGASGAPQAFEGAAGFAHAFAGLTGWSADHLDLSGRWRILDVIYKPYPVCALAQTPVAVAVDLAEREDLAPGEVDQVRLSMNPAERDYPGTLNDGPFTDVGATLMSASFCLAIALRDRGATLEALREFEDPVLLDLVRRIEVLPDPSLPEVSARVELTTKDGRTLAGELIPDARTYNWDWDEVSVRAQVLQPEMEGDLERLCDAVRALESADALAAATLGAERLEHRHAAM